MKETKKKRRKKTRMKKVSFVLKAVVVMWVAVFATKPVRGSCRTICHLLPTLVDISAKRVSRPALSSEQLNRNKQRYQRLRAIATRIPLIGRTVTLPHDLVHSSCLRRSLYHYGCPPPPPPPFCRSGRCDLKNFGTKTGVSYVSLNNGPKVLPGAVSLDQFYCLRI